jgi:hypothetical protein
MLKKLFPNLKLTVMKQFEFPASGCHLAVANAGSTRQD